jgi:hypothetical protein
VVVEAQVAIQVIEEHDPEEIGRNPGEGDELPDLTETNVKPSLDM